MYSANDSTSIDFTNSTNDSMLVSLTLSFPDIIREIVQHIDCGSQFKAARLISKEFNRWCDHARWSWRHFSAEPGDIVFADHQMTICKILGTRPPAMIPKEKISVKEFLCYVTSMASYQINVLDINHQLEQHSMEELVEIYDQLKNIYKGEKINKVGIWFPYSMRYIVGNAVTPNATVEDIDDTFQYHNSGRARKIPIDYIIQHKDKPWNWLSITGRNDLKLRHVLDNPDIEWSDMLLSCSPCLTIDFYLANADKLLPELVAMNLAIPIPFVMSRPELRECFIESRHDMPFTDEDLDAGKYIPPSNIHLTFDRFKRLKTRNFDNFRKFNPNCTWKIVRDNIGLFRSIYRTALGVSTKAHQNLW